MILIWKLKSLIQHVEEVSVQDIIAIIQAQEQKQDIGLAGSGNMKLKEFTDIDLDIYGIQMWISLSI